MTTDSPRPLLEHLEELRSRLAWALGSVALAAALSFAFADDVFKLLMKPGIDAVTAQGRTLTTLSPPEQFLVSLKTALLFGFLISLPMTLYQAWAFVSPGLYKSEKRLAAPFVITSSLLFLGGAAFGREVAFPFVFDYFISLENEYVVNQWTMQALFTFQSRLYLAFGIAFQLPIAMFFFAAAGIFSVEAMAQGRRYAIVAMFVLGAILTPPDVVSQALLAFPMIALYEIGLLAARVAARRRVREASFAEAGDS